ncbi:response regulator [Mucilaginibacter ginsenosidivorax]|uniref:Response regulator n=2 Tax=Mucilaginibacter ginsenosidivorax TaxID=862126 RepID=A0A5B8W3E5_9SPHI|nr:response regulator [Mucilaginibacter ginsenosidivorax]
MLKLYHNLYTFHLSKVGFNCKLINGMRFALVKPKGIEMSMAKKILIVDNNELMIEVMTYILTANGYDVVSFHDAGNIFAEIKTSHPDLVILDVLLPGLDSLEICKLIKLNRNTKNLPVIICLPGEDVGTALNQKGAPDDVLLKPFGINNLIEKVEYQLAA